jgi:uncharacterized protein YciI
MYAVAVIRYRRDLDEVLGVLDAHRAYLRTLFDAGTLLASGPLVPRSGGLLLLRVPDGSAQQALDSVRDNDPYVKSGMAQYELLPWAPTTGIDKLDQL